MRDWIMLAIGTLGGSSVTGAVAVYIDSRKRRDEKHNRDREKKQQAYTQYTQFASLFFNELMVMSSVKPIARRAKGGTANAADLEELERVLTRVHSNRVKLHESTSAALHEIAMLAPNHVRDAATDVVGTCWKLSTHLIRDEDDEIEATQSTFNKLIHEFRSIARSDLGIDETTNKPPRWRLKPRG
jgi:hypothetical protein